MNNNYYKNNNDNDYENKNNIESIKKIFDSSKNYGRYAKINKYRIREGLNHISNMFEKVDEIIIKNECNSIVDINYLNKHNYNYENVIIENNYFEKICISMGNKFKNIMFYSLFLIYDRFCQNKQEYIFGYYINDDDYLYFKVINNHLIYRYKLGNIDIKDIIIYDTRLSNFEIKCKKKYGYKYNLVSKIINYFPKIIIKSIKHKCMATLTLHLNIKKIYEKNNDELIAIIKNFIMNNTMHTNMMNNTENNFCDLKLIVS